MIEVRSLGVTPRLRTSKCSCGCYCGGEFSAEWCFIASMCCRTADAISEICKEDDESPEHIISGCPIGKQFWEKLGLTSMVRSRCTQHSQDNTGERDPKGRVCSLRCFVLLVTMEDKECSSIQR